MVSSVELIPVLLECPEFFPRLFNDAFGLVFRLTYGGAQLVLQDEDIFSKASIASIIISPLRSLEDILALGSQELGDLVIMHVETTEPSLFSCLINSMNEYLPELVEKSGGIFSSSSSDTPPHPLFLCSPTLRAGV